MKIKEIHSISNIDDIVDFIKSNPEKRYFFRPLETNYNSLDCILYLGKNYSFSNDNFTRGKEASFNKELDLLISVQIKKDFNFDQYSEIKEKWKSKKKTINNSVRRWYEHKQEMDDNLKEAPLNLVLIIITEDEKRKTEFQKKEKENDIFLCFTDRINVSKLFF